MKQVSLAMLLALAVLVPSRASAQTAVAEQQCVNSFLAACATLQYIDFGEKNGKGVLTLLVSNTSDAALALDAYIRALVFDLTGNLPAVQATATAQYGFWDGSRFNATNGDQEQWNVKTAQKTPGDLDSGFTVDLSVKDDAKTEDGGNKDRIAGVGESVEITINFQDAFGAGVGFECADPANCQSWSAEMKGWDADGDGKVDGGYTTPGTHSPEPATFFLLASGLLGLGGVQMVRRRRQGAQSE